jgi:OOP family OmpA-OmpF porin
MKKYYLKIIAIFMVASLAITKMNAQEVSNQSLKLFNGTKDFSTWSVGLNVGGLIPMSAFGGRNDFSEWETNFGYGFYVKNQLSHVFALQADFLGGKLSANNNRLWAGVPPPSPYSSYKTDLNWSASLSAVATLGNINWTQLNTAIKPYLSIGMGMVGYESTLTTVENLEVKGHPDGAVSTLFIPVGLGFKARLSPSLNLDLGYKVGFVDGDDLDGYYKDPIMNDRFSYAHVGIEFAIQGKSKPQLARHNAPRQMSKEFADRDYALAEEVRLLNTNIAARDNEIKSLKAEHVTIKKDSDADGVSDYFDKCPGTPTGTRVDGAGCAYEIKTIERMVEAPSKMEITADDYNVIKEATENLQFETGSTVLKSVSYAYLHRVADILLKKNLSIKLAGYTDNVGSESSNLRLSKERVNTVKAYLAKQGVGDEHITAVGYGEADPIATNKTAAGRAKNRRVEFTFY